MDISATQRQLQNGVDKKKMKKEERRKKKGEKNSAHPFRSPEYRKLSPDTIISCGNPSVSDFRSGFASGQSGWELASQVMAMV